MNRFLTIALCSLLVLSGCGISVTTEDPLRLYVFDCGKLMFDSVEAFGIGDDETDVRELSAPCYMIEHPKGRLLWDGGLPPSVAEKPGWHGEGGIKLRLDSTLAEQLDGMGLDMSAFDYVAFSHMHFDHVGIANDIKGATLIIQEAEHRAAFADEVNTPGFNPSYYEKLRDAEPILINGDHDLFGDGRVRIISAPGHTPGHQALFVDLANTGPIVLSGDLYHFRFSRDHKRVPTFNVDAQMSLESMERVERLLEETGATLWMQHDLAWFEKLKKAPQYYD